jgi:hypothetical protein
MPVWTLTLLGALDSLKSVRPVVNTNEDLEFDNLNIDTQFDISSASSVFPVSPDI